MSQKETHNEKYNNKKNIFERTNLKNVLFIYFIVQYYYYYIKILKCFWIILFFLPTHQEKRLTNKDNNAYYTIIKFVNTGSFIFSEILPRTYNNLNLYWVYNNIIWRRNIKFLIKRIYNYSEMRSIPCQYYKIYMVYYLLLYIYRINLFENNIAVGWKMLKKLKNIL